MAARGKPKYQDYLEAFKRASEQKDCGPVVALAGPSQYLRTRSADALKKSWQALGLKVDCADAPELDETRFLALFGQESLFEPKGAVLIRRAEQASSLAKWLKALSRISKPTLFVFTKDAVPAPVAKELGRLGAIEVPCVEPARQDLPVLVKAIARKKGLTLSPEATNLLFESLGEDLVKIDGELEKIAFVFPGRKEPLTSEDVAPYLGVLRQDHAFAMDRLLLDREFAKAHVLSLDLLDRGEEPLKLLGLLARHCRQALKISQDVSRGLPLKEVAQRSGLPLGVAKSYTAYVAKIPKSRLVRALDLCREADLSLKSSRAAPDLLIGSVVEALAGS